MGISVNVGKVARDNWEEKNEKKIVLRSIHQKAYELYMFSHRTEEEIMTETLNFAKIAISNGVVTQQEVENEIASVIMVKRRNEQLKQGIRK